MNIGDRIQNLRESLFPGNSTKQKVNNAAIKLAAQIRREHTLYRKEIAQWKQARMLALDNDMPRRYLLQQLYDDIMIDAFIFGKWENRKLRISNRKIQVLSGGEVDEDKTNLLKTLWFNKFVKFYIDSRAYGYNLMYPKTLGEDGFIKDIATVYRTNIVPETCEILKNTQELSGAKFNEPPLVDWCMFFGDADDLGILDKAAPLWIFKKHSWQNWDEFEEMFGIPIRIAKLASEDKRVQEQVKSWLKTLGSAAYGMFPQGTEIEILENKTQDAFNVFNEKRKAVNEELAILIDGQFESSNDSGSRAKAETVLENTQDEIRDDDATMTLFAINEVLIPFLIKRGYPFTEDDQVVWNDNKETTPAERLKIFAGVKKLGYKLDIDQVSSELDVIIEEDDTPPPNPQPPANFKEPHNHVGCGAHSDTYRLINLDEIDDLTPDERALLRRLWKERENVNWSYKAFKKNHGELLQAIRSGYGEVDFDFESVDHGTMEAFNQNIHRFGVDKTQKQIFDLNKIIKDPEVDSFTKFFKRARKVFPNYNRTWAETEWEQAHATSQAAATYRDYMDNIDIAPYWQYKTVEDERVRPEHRALHNKVFRKDDASAWTFKPPNGWKCRCDDIELIDYDGEVSDLSDAIGADPDGYEKMIKSGHNVNWGDAKQVFTASQGYLSGLPIGAIDFDTFDFKTFGLKPVSKLIKRENIGTGKFNFSKLTDRSGLARFDSAEDLPIWMDKGIADVTDASIIHKLKDVLKTPDELFTYKQGDDTIKSYFKHYKDGTLNALVQLDPDAISKITAFVKLENPDTWRNGLLIHSPALQVERQLQLYNSYSTDFKKSYFNSQNGGFVTIHKGHGKNELKQNEAIADKLAKKGTGVSLLDNLENTKSPDAELNGIAWEFKSLSNYNNLSNAIDQALRSGVKQSSNILLDIKGAYSIKALINGISSRVLRNNKIKFVGLLFNDGRFLKLSRKQIETGEYLKLLKK
jgi:SPP1 gp7 family putative phage head morphogenesis protein